MNSPFESLEYLLAEFAWDKVRFTCRVLRRDGPRVGLSKAWDHALRHLETEHIPESVRDDFEVLSRFMRTELAGSRRSFHETTSDFEIVQAASAFWRLYEAVERWYIRLNDEANQREFPTH